MTLDYKLNALPIELIGLIFAIWRLTVSMFIYILDWTWIDYIYLLPKWCIRGHGGKNGYVVYLEISTFSSVLLVHKYILVVCQKVYLGVCWSGTFDRRSKDPRVRILHWPNMNFSGH